MHQHQLSWTQTDVASGSSTPWGEILGAYLGEVPISF